MKRFLCFFIAIAGIACSNAQNSESFQKYRQKMLSEYNQFRKSVLDNYADYLNTVWKEYETFKAKERDKTPKPKIVPNIDTTPVVTTPIDTTPIDVPVVTVPVEPAPVMPVAKPEIPKAKKPYAEFTTSFSFYGITLKAPVLRCASLASLEKDAAEAWKNYEKGGVKLTAVKMKDYALSLGLNDWFIYEIVRECVNSQNAACSKSERASLQHYLLANMGYDVRLAVNNDIPVLLVNSAEEVYARNYVNIDGKPYYMYGIDDSSINVGGLTATCDLPPDLDLGRGIDFMLTKPLLLSSGNEHTCSLKWKDMMITINVDACIMEMLRHYPILPIPVYAKSNLLPDVRNSVLRQLEPYIKELSEKDAANLLLHFVQKAFAYATDGEQHQYEKTYFFEENFYYPKNDCEDRAVFYAYIVNQLLGLDVHLIMFPGHECTAVHFNDDTITGDGYIYNSRKYIICDPTYVGADIGNCMPDYRDTKPQVQIWLR